MRVSYFGNKNVIIIFLIDLDDSVVTGRAIILTITPLYFFLCRHYK